MSDTERLNLALAGRYRLEREIGQGGMATVFLAQDIRHRRRVALKVIRPEMAQAVTADRFMREIEVVARLSHPHIVPLYDSGEANGELFYVMPYVEGESLRRRLERERQLPIDDALRITGQVASALEYAHARDVIHRDIKPENILLFEGQALVTDFGIAMSNGNRPSDKRLTATGSSVGTPVYMSPEQALGEPTDKRSDMYSLGCVLFEMLAGEPPHDGPTAQSILAKRLADAIPAVRTLRPSVPSGVDHAISRAIAKLPADRFASLAEFRAALNAPVQPRAAAVAVLPFYNMSADPDSAFFADGITEDVIAHLAKIRALTVIARSSVMPFRDRTRSIKEVAAALSATTVLDGSVRRAGDRVRIVATLIDADTERHLWVETYDRQLTDIFAIQTDVALHIATALRAELSRDEQSRVRKEPTSDLEAYKYFLQGRQHMVKWTPESLASAVEYFNQAIARDPEFALAHAELAMSYAEYADNGSMDPAVAYDRARRAAAEALRLDPELSAGYTVMGYLKTMSEFDWSAAEANFRRALELSPSNADAHDHYGRLLSALGRFDEAVEMHARAHALDPLTHLVDIATTLLRAGRYEESIQRASNAVAVEPHSSRAHATLGWGLFFSGRRDEGVAAIQHAASLARSSTLWVAQLGQALGLAGRSDEARRIAEQMEERSAKEFVSPYHLAYVYVGLGEHEKALDWLELAVSQRSGASYGIKGSFLLAPLRPHPRFQALLRSMSLA